MEKIVTKFILQRNAKTCQNALKSIVTNVTLRCAFTLKSMEDVNLTVTAPTLIMILISKKFLRKQLLVK